MQRAHHKTDRNKGSENVFHKTRDVGMVKHIQCALKLANVDLGRYNVTESTPCSCSAFHRLAFPCIHMGHHPYISTCICGNRVYSLNACTDPRVGSEFLYKWHLYSDTVNYSV